MAVLSPQQQSVIELDEDVFVTACPGSGKTRVLTEKIISTLEKGISPHQRVAALTFTNRAADEMAGRLQERGFSRRQLWIGTIHSFALDWILRPYASYCDELRKGFSVADEHYARKLLKSLKDNHNVKFIDDLRTGFDRDGNLVTNNQAERTLIKEFHATLRSRKLIDYDSVLYLAFDLLQREPEIPRTLGAIFHLFCIDEYQDTQDLQFGILSTIVRNSAGKLRLFIVGDKNQAIYTSLGGIAKTLEEIRHEFDRPDMLHRELSGNYRSTQRIVDFCANFCEAGSEQITSKAEYAGELGLITVSNQVIHRDGLAEAVGGIVQYHLSRGVKAEEICVMGPRWWLLMQLGRQLVIHLPDVDLDAPGLSPLRYQPDSMWFKLARLLLTDATPSRYRTRIRWAADFVSSLETFLGKELSEEKRRPRHILRLTNALNSSEESGLAYLDEVFELFFEALEIDLTLHPEAMEAREMFFEAAEDRLIDGDGDSQIESVENLKKMFRHPSGIVINSCHGAKGEEYEVVICFGLLRGYVPHWERIIDKTVDDKAESKRILYVICSRAKRFIHLFAEDGHVTKRGDSYETTRELVDFTWRYDEFQG